MVVPRHGQPNTDEVELSSLHGGRLEQQQQHLQKPADPVSSLEEKVQALTAEWQAAGRVPHVYEIWHRFGARSRLFMRGRCVKGPDQVDIKFNVCAWLGLIMPSSFYFVVCLPSLWAANPLLPLATGVLFLCTVGLMLLTSYTDPGIIPRPALQLLVEGLDEEVRRAIGCGELPVKVGCLEPDPSLMELLRPRGYEWCRFCRMLQPPRAKHCRDCDSCILRADHHCPFVNNCIGQRNYVFFFGFLVAAVLLGLAVLGGISVWYADLPEKGTRGDIPNSSTVFGLVCASIVMMAAALLLGVLCLCACHANLIYRGRTTREALTGHVRGEGATLLGFRGPSLIHGDRLVRLPDLV